MIEITQNLLHQIGEQLNHDIYPDVMDGGIVTLPSDPNPFPFNMGEEKCDYGYYTRGSEARSRQRTAIRERTSRRSRSTTKSSDANIFSRLRNFYETDLDALRKAYPSLKVWNRDDGIWIRVTSQLLDGSPTQAVFLVGIALTNPMSVRGWAFWDGFDWIGPRHTNIPDGSICAFEPRDPNSWKLGESLVVLLDIYSVWAVRHLCLRRFGKWPGRQTVHFAFERLMELSDDELCGCGKNQRYVDCCKQSDHHPRLLEEAICMANDGLLCPRQPPDSVITCVRNFAEPPALSIIQ